jgi:hypothetical protein
MASPNGVVYNSFDDTGQALVIGLINHPWRIHDETLIHRNLPLFPLQEKRHFFKRSSKSRIGEALVPGG